MFKLSSIAVGLGFLIFWISTTAAVATLGKDVHRIEKIKKIEEKGVEK